MTRKIIILTFGYFALGILTFTSCDLFVYDATICDIRFAGLHSIGNIDSEEPDTFDDQIGFELMSIESSKTCYRPQVQIFNSANATTKCADFQNQLLKWTYQISLDRSIALDDDTIPSDTNLMNYYAIKSLTEIEVNEECRYVTSTIIFKPELIDRIEFETGEYEVTFRCSTSDSREFTKARKVIFKE